jgi:hypothetical protein
MNRSADECEDSSEAPLIALLRRNRSPLRIGQWQGEVLYRCFSPTWVGGHVQKRAALCAAFLAFVVAVAFVFSD